MPISKLKASSIASGTIDNARISLDAAEIPALPTSKITSGTFADARIAASNVSQHATSFDDDKLVNDLSTLGLRVHTQENLSASTTNSQYIDVFQDNTGITNLTNVQNVSEYLASVYTQTTTLTDGIAGASNGAVNNNSTNYTGADSTVRAGGKLGYAGLTSSGGSYSAYNFNHIFPADTPFELIVYVRGYYQGVGFIHGSSLNLSHLSYGNSFWDGSASNMSYNGTVHPFSGQNITFNGKYHAPLTNDGSSDYNNLYRFNRDSSNNFTIQYYGRSTNTITLDSTALSNIRSSSNYVQDIGGSQTISGQMICGFGEATGNNSQFSIEAASETTTAASATGSFENNAITASSATTKMGAVITYQDQAGTNALNTDIVLQLSADGGSNYSTATLTALPDFSTGIKCAKVNDLAVTSGTSLKYKILFANQASGSKEARIRGVSLNY